MTPASRPGPRRGLIALAGAVLADAGAVLLAVRLFGEAARHDTRVGSHLALLVLPLALSAVHARLLAGPRRPETRAAPGVHAVVTLLFVAALAVTTTLALVDLVTVLLGIMGLGAATCTPGHAC